MHKQAWAKVNAPVDEGIKELVEALSLFPKLQTIECCEDIGNGVAWVCFNYGDVLEPPFNELADFVLGFFGPKLISKLGDMVNVSIQLSGVGVPHGELSVRPGVLFDTIRILKKLAS